MADILSTIIESGIKGASETTRSGINCVILRH